MMILIIGFTCPPTIHFKFITKICKICCSLTCSWRCILWLQSRCFSPAIFVSWLCRAFLSTRDFNFDKVCCSLYLFLRCFKIALFVSMLFVFMLPLFWAKYKWVSCSSRWKLNMFFLIACLVTHILSLFFAKPKRLVSVDGCVLFKSGYAMCLCCFHSLDVFICFQLADMLIVCSLDSRLSSGCVKFGGLHMRC